MSRVRPFDAAFVILLLLQGACWLYGYILLKKMAAGDASTDLVDIFLFVQKVQFGLMVLILAFLLYFIPPALLVQWRRRKGLCLKCGYDLTGNRSGTCPECGTPITVKPPAPNRLT